MLIDAYNGRVSVPNAEQTMLTRHGEIAREIARWETWIAVILNAVTSRETPQSSRLSRLASVEGSVPLSQTKDRERVET